MVRSSELLAKLKLGDLDLILRGRRLRFFWHEDHSTVVIRIAVVYRLRAGGGREAQATHGRN